MASDAPRAQSYDAVVVGGGMAGLSAAHWLARYRRSVCVFDAGAPRNEPAWAVHGYPGLVDPAPMELRRRLFEQATGAGAEVVNGIARGVTGEKNAFRVEADCGTVSARRVVLAYGLRDHIPDIENIESLYGVSVHHCPDCDGPSVADGRVGVIGWDRDAAKLALYLRHWAASVALLAHGTALDLSAEAHAVLREAEIAIHEPAVVRVHGKGGHLTHAELTGGERVELDAIFFHLGSEPRSDIAARIACATDRAGYVTIDHGQETSVAGVYAAGDLTGHPHLAVTAAAEGVRAAMAIHRSLLPPSWELSHSD